MKTKAPILILIVLCLGLGVALVLQHNKAVDQQRQDESRILQYSNEWVTTSSKLNTQVEENRGLTNRLTAKQVELEKKDKEAGELRTTLTQVEAERAAKVAAVKAAEEQIDKLTKRIGELEERNTALDKQAGELKSAITDREAKITDTQKRLAASEGDRELLLKELKRLQAEKADLERKFNDLVMLREQVRKLRDELAISKRLEWIKKGIYGAAVSSHGAQLLQKGFEAPGATGKTNFDLNVEVKRDGGAKVVAPTNAPPAPPR